MTVLRQADRRWSSLLLGNGPGRIGDKGCLLTCITQAAVLLGTRPTLLPPHANESARQGGVFHGDRLVMAQACALLGLRSDPLEWTGMHAPVFMHATAIQLALGAGGCAVLHVDHDSRRTNGDPDGDHFVLAVELKVDDPAHVVCADPATGALEWLGADDLQGVVRWGREVKSYVVRGVRPIYAATTARAETVG